MFSMTILSFGVGGKYLNYLLMLGLLMLSHDLSFGLEWFLFRSTPVAVKSGSF